MPVDPRFLAHHLGTPWPHGVAQPHRFEFVDGRAGNQRS
jgi:hypothetical protein